MREIAQMGKYAVSGLVFVLCSYFLASTASFADPAPQTPESLGQSESEEAMDEEKSAPQVQEDTDSSETANTKGRSTLNIDRSVLDVSRDLELPEKLSSQEKPDPDHHYAKAREALSKKQYREALTQVNEALRLNPSHWKATYLGCLCLQMSGRTDEAIRKYRRLVKFKPELVEARTNLGVLLKQTGELEEAEHHYRRAIDTNFYSVDAHYNLANLLIEKNDLEGALAELKACLKLEPSNAWVHNNLGVIYLKRNYLEEAEEEFLRALNLEPANKTFERNLHAVREHLKKKPIRA